MQSFLQCPNPYEGALQIPASPPLARHRLPCESFINLVSFTISTQIISPKFHINHTFSVNDCSTFYNAACSLTIPLSTTDIAVSTTFKPKSLGSSRARWQTLSHPHITIFSPRSLFSQALKSAYFRYSKPLTAMPAQHSKTTKRWLNKEGREGKPKPYQLAEAIAEIPPVWQKEFRGAKRLNTFDISST